MSVVVYETSFRLRGSPTSNIDVTEDRATKFWNQAADRASRYKKDSMPTKHEIEFNFMGLKLTDVLHDLNVQLELRFLSRLLATALNQKVTLERLPFREWILSAPTADASNIDCSFDEAG